MSKQTFQRATDAVGLFAKENKYFNIFLHSSLWRKKDASCICTFRFYLNVCLWKVYKPVSQINRYFFGHIYRTFFTGNFWTKPTVFHFKKYGILSRASVEKFLGMGQWKNQDREITSISLPLHYPVARIRGRTGPKVRTHLKVTQDQEPRVIIEDFFRRNTPFRKTTSF